MEAGLAVAPHFFVCNAFGLDDLAKKKKHDHDDFFPY